MQAETKPMENNAINILSCCRDDLARYVPVLLSSLYKNHEGISIRMFLMHPGLIPESTIRAIKRYAEDNNQEFHEILVDDNDFEAFKAVHPARLDKWPLATYYKLLAHQYLPKDVKRVLHLDIDTVCNGNVYDWYNTEFDGSFFITTTRYNVVSGIQSFNAGCFLINVEKLRQEGIDVEFYRKKIEAHNKERVQLKIPLIADQNFLGYAFKDFENNGIKQFGSKAINFRPQREINLKNAKKPLSVARADIKIAHYIYSVAKPWNFILDESFLHLYLGRFMGGAAYDMQVITEDVLWIFDLFWKYAIGTPFYEEIRREADPATKVIKDLSWLRTRERKYETLLKAVELKESEEKAQMEKHNIVIPKASFNDYNMACTAKDNYVEYKTNYYIKDQWIVFPLKQGLVHGEHDIFISCEYKTKNKIFLFLSDYDLNIQHLPPISSKKYSEKFAPDRDGYQFLCLSSDSFKAKGDYIRIFEMSLEKHNATRSFCRRVKKALKRRLRGLKKKALKLAKKPAP